jgi:hypothetical protein
MLEINNQGSVALIVGNRPISQQLAREQVHLVHYPTVRKKKRKLKQLTSRDHVMELGG